MRDESTNGRTHEPSLRELTAELEGLKELMVSKFEASGNLALERDTRYEQRFKAMDEKTGLALTASEKAVVKAETATEKRFDSVNEFRGQLKDQASTLLPRLEADAQFKVYEDKIDLLKDQAVTLLPRSEADTQFRGYDDKIDDLKKEIHSLRESRVVTVAKELEKKETQSTVQWSVGTILTVISMLFGLVSVFVAVTLLIMRMTGK